MEIKKIAEHQEFIEDKFTKRVMYKGDNHLVFVLNFEPGAALPAHNHPGSNVYLLVLEGSGTMVSDGKEVPVSQGEAIQISGDEMISYKAINRSSVYVVITGVGDERFAKDV